MYIEKQDIINYSINTYQNKAHRKSLKEQERKKINAKDATVALYIFYR